MGNPHAVVFLDNSIDLAQFPLDVIGPSFESHPYFPERVNTEFVQVISPSLARMRVYERGSGETLACGTGCCAVTAACVLNGLTNRQLTIEVRGGRLTCTFDEIRPLPHSFYPSNDSTSFNQRAALASEGIRRSVLGESETLPIFGPSGRQLRLNCWAKNLR